MGGASSKDEAASGGSRDGQQAANNNNNTSSAPQGSNKQGSGVPVYLNVYNLQRVGKGGNSINSAMGFGFYHSGVEVLGLEYSFGGNPAAEAQQCGIFCVYPKSVLPPDQFYEQVKLGEIVGLKLADVQAILREMAPEWRAVSYHLLKHNCNHFSEAFSWALAKKFKVEPGFSIPAYINRAARFADVFVPDRVYNAMMRRVPQPPQGAPAGQPQFTPQATPYAQQQQRQQQQQQHGHSHTGGSCPHHSHGSAAGANRAQDDEEDTKIPIPESPEEMKKMSVRELKTAMWVNGISWDGCIEKDDLINAIIAFRKQKK